MAAIPGSVRVAGFVAPFDSTDIYAVTDPTYGRGSLRSVANIVARNAITKDRRLGQLGMEVVTIDTMNKYRLINEPGTDGTTDTDWELMEAGDLWDDTGTELTPHKSRDVCLATDKKYCFEQPVDSTFYATYLSSINGDYGLGSVTGASFGGASIVSGWLDLTHGDNRYVSYDAALNASSQQSGAFKFKVKPNYSDAPLNNYVFFSISAANLSSVNLIVLYHVPTTGIVTLSVYDHSGASIITGGDLGVWFPTSGTIYEFELDFDITSGATRLFIDGIQSGSTLIETGIRSNDIHVFEVGQAVNINTFFSNFFIKDFIVYDAVQHIANYTPGYSLQNIQFSTDGSAVNDLEVYGTTTLSGLLVNNGILQTNGSGVVSSSTALPNGTTATTQASTDNSTKVATTAFVQSITEMASFTWDGLLPFSTFYVQNNIATLTNGITVALKGIGHIIDNKGSVYTNMNCVSFNSLDAPRTVNIAQGVTLSQVPNLLVNVGLQSQSTAFVLTNPSSPELVYVGRGSGLYCDPAIPTAKFISLTGSNSLQVYINGGVVYGGHIFDLADTSTLVVSSNVNPFADSTCFYGNSSLILYYSCDSRIPLKSSFVNFTGAITYIPNCDATADGNISIANWDGSILFSDFYAAQNIATLTGNLIVSLKGTGHTIDNKGSMYTNIVCVAFQSLDSQRQIDVADGVTIDNSPVLINNIVLNFKTTSSACTDPTSIIQVGQGCIIQCDSSSDAIFSFSDSVHMTFKLDGGAIYGNGGNVIDIGGASTQIWLEIHNKATVDAAAIFGTVGTLNLSYTNDVTVPMLSDFTNYSGNINYLPSSDANLLENATNVIWDANIAWSNFYKQQNISDLSNELIITLRGTGHSITSNDASWNNMDKVSFQSLDEVRTISFADGVEFDEPPRFLFNITVKSYSTSHICQDPTSEIYLGYNCKIECDPSVPDAVFFYLENYSSADLKLKGAVVGFGKVFDLADNAILNVTALNNSIITGGSLYGDSDTTLNINIDDSSSIFGSVSNSSGTVNYTNWGFQAFTIVQNKTAMYNIPIWKRERLMEVAVIDDNCVYILITNPLTDTTTSIDWQTSGVTMVNGQIYLGGTTINLTSTLNTGLISGGRLSINVGDSSKFDISAGSAIIVDKSNPDLVSISLVTWIALVGCTTPYLATASNTFISLDSSASLVTSLTELTRTQLENTIRIGRVSHLDNAHITGYMDTPIFYYQDLDLAYFFIVFGTINFKGGNLSANGSNLHLNHASAILGNWGANSVADIKSPNYITVSAESAFTFVKGYLSADHSTAIIIFPGTTSLDPDHWDDGSGTLASVSGTNFTVQTLIYIPGGYPSPVKGMLYGQKQYATFNEALQNSNIDFPIIPANIQGGVVFGRLIVQTGTTDLAAAIAGGTAQFLGGTLFGCNFQGGGGGGGSPVVSFADISGDPMDNASLALDFNAKANDNAVLHLTGAETAAGVKEFTDAIKATGGFTDTNVTTAVALGDASHTALNTTNKTLIGGINEVLSDIPSTVPIYQVIGNLNPEAENWFFDHTLIQSAGSQNSFQVMTLKNFPDTVTEVDASITVNSSTAVAYALFSWQNSSKFMAGFKAGIPALKIWAKISSPAASAILRVNAYRYRTYPGVTVTITGSGTNRSATTSGSFFEAGDNSSSPASASLLVTPNGNFQIRTMASDVSATIIVPSGYVNESGVAVAKYKNLYKLETANITNTGAYQEYTAFATEASPEYSPVNSSWTWSESNQDKIAFGVWGVTSSISDVTISFTIDGYAHCSHAETPKLLRVGTHSELSLGGGIADNIREQQVNTSAATTMTFQLPEDVYTLLDSNVVLFAASGYNSTVNLNTYYSDGFTATNNQYTSTLSNIPMTLTAHIVSALSINSVLSSAKAGSVGSLKISNNSVTAVFQVIGLKFNYIQY
jgi:hypothetical protein